MFLSHYCTPVQARQCFYMFHCVIWFTVTATWVHFVSAYCLIWLRKCSFQVWVNLQNDCVPSKYINNSINRYVWLCDMFFHRHVIIWESHSHTRNTLTDKNCAGGVYVCQIACRRECKLVLDLRLFAWGTFASNGLCVLSHFNRLQCDAVLPPPAPWHIF